MQSSADQRFHMSECEKWESRVSCRTLGGVTVLLLLVIDCQPSLRRQHVVWDAIGAVVGLTAIVEECM